MKKFDNVFFDLDGTLTDPCVGITSSVQYALKHFGIEEDVENLKKFIGPPLKDMFVGEYNLTSEQGDEAVVKYRERYIPQGLFENYIYPDTKKMLSELQNRGKKIVLATSKPEELAVMVLKKFEIFDFFDVVAGADFEGFRVRKGDVIKYAMNLAKISSPRNCVMVGDRMHDVVGAKENDMECIGVLYGYGDRAELESANADYIVENQLDVLEIIK